MTETVPYPDLKDLICPVTGQMMKRAFTERIEVLARKPPEYYVRQLIRTVFASPGGDAVSYSPWPSDVLPKSRIDVSLIATILTSPITANAGSSLVTGSTWRPTRWSLWCVRLTKSSSPFTRQSSKKLWPSITS